MVKVIFAIAGYLVGSVLFARIVSSFYKVDIGRLGSGNPGATNVTRVISKGAGIAAFFGDFLKSFLLVLFALKFGPARWNSGVELGIVTMLGLIIGHNFPIFFNFKGGKGISVAMGGCMALMPGTVMVGMLMWYVIFHATGFVSLASLFFAISLPITSFAFGYDMRCVFLTFTISAIVLWRHRNNVKRLWNGSEYRFGKS
jgi:glycerol-3-phosphate acyltransferase PlsY